MTDLWMEYDVVIDHDRWFTSANVQELERCEEQICNYLHLITCIIDTSNALGFGGYNLINKIEEVKKAKRFLHETCLRAGPPPTKCVPIPRDLINA